MRFRRTLILILGLLSIGTQCFAGSLKTITLSDGTAIVGEVLRMENGVYTIKTTHLGEIKVDEEKVLNITSQAQAVPKTVVQSGGVIPSGGTAQKGSIKDQTQQVQSQVLSNPQIMGKIQSLLDDPQIKEMMSDPNLLKDIMTYDEETIRSNPNIQKLMNNPRIKNLIKEIEQETNITE